MFSIGIFMVSIIFLCFITIFVARYKVFTNQHSSFPSRISIEVK